MNESEFRKRELEHIRQQLAGRDVPCPKCGYNLRDLEHGICPECGHFLELGRMHTPKPAPGRDRLLLLREWVFSTAGAVSILIAAALLTAVLHEYAPWLLAGPIAIVGIAGLFFVLMMRNDTR